MIMDPVEDLDLLIVIVGDDGQDVIINQLNVLIQQILPLSLVPIGRDAGKEFRDGICIGVKLLDASISRCVVARQEGFRQCSKRDQVHGKEI